MEFYIILKELLGENKLSQEKFAKEIGYSQRAVSKWINKQSEPSASAIYKIAKYFNVSADYLLGL